MANKPSSRTQNSSAAAPVALGPSARDLPCAPPELVALLGELHPELRRCSDREKMLAAAVGELNAAHSALERVPDDAAGPVSGLASALAERVALAGGRLREARAAREAALNVVRDAVAAWAGPLGLARDSLIRVEHWKEVRHRLDAAMQVTGCEYAREVAVMQVLGFDVLGEGNELRLQLVLGAPAGFGASSRNSPGRTLTLRLDGREPPDRRTRFEPVR